MYDDLSTETARGYLHADYARSLAEHGEPRPLPCSGGWLLERPVPGSPRRDATGCYPLFLCRHWALLAEDLDNLPRDLLSVSLVADPFGAWSEESLACCFPDLRRPFKEHFVVDLRRAAPSRHHRRKIRRARRAVDVEASRRPGPWLDDWERLYDGLRRRRALTGLHAFSRESFRAQLDVPGCVAFRVLARGACVAMSLWYAAGDVAYYHLGASDDEGYRLSASYALVQAAIDMFGADGARWLCLGAQPDAGHGEDGLARFKRGWATGTRTAWLCGRIVDRAGYAALAPGRATDYFPAYRTP